MLARVEPEMNVLGRVGAVEGAVPVHKSKNVQRAVNAVYRQAWDALNTTNTNMLYMVQDAYKQLVQGIANKARAVSYTHLDVYKRQV